MQVPMFLLRLKSGWMRISHAMGRVVSRVLLTVFWVTVIGLYAIILKIARAMHPSSNSSRWQPCASSDAQSMRYQS